MEDEVYFVYSRLGFHAESCIHQANAGRDQDIVSNQNLAEDSGVMEVLREGLEYLYRISR